MSGSNSGALYIVATPIGNLGDMVPRAINVLQTVDIIAAEDTRHSKKLLQHFGISTKLMAYHDYSNELVLQKIINFLESGQSVALISDAGTPLISDPGYELVHAAREVGIKVVPIPGACAFIAALSASGLPFNRLVFEGFLPAKSASRNEVLSTIEGESRTVIFYESPHRIMDTLNGILAVLGDERYIVLAREITKTFETILSGTASQLIQQLEADVNQKKGEFVVLVKGINKVVDHSVNEDAERLMKVLLEYVPIKIASAIASKVTGCKKRDLYPWALSLK